MTGIKFWLEVNYGFSFFLLMMVAKRKIDKLYVIRVLIIAMIGN